VLPHPGECASFNAYAGRIHGVLRRLGVIRY
jgi:hypothetical protein